MLLSFLKICKRKDYSFLFFLFLSCISNLRFSTKKNAKAKSLIPSHKLSQLNVVTNSIIKSGPQIRLRIKELYQILFESFGIPFCWPIQPFSSVPTMEQTYLAAALASQIFAGAEVWGDKPLPNRSNKARVAAYWAGIL